jgi:hypothetical protein
MRRERDPDTQSTGSARWQRRAARQDAERRRMPKHGKGYVDLTQRMIARRATATQRLSGDGSRPRRGGRYARRRRRGAGWAPRRALLGGKALGMASEAGWPPTDAGRVAQSRRVSSSRALKVQSSPLWK